MVTLRIFYHYIVLGTAVHLVNLHCTSSLLYGCEMWSLKTSDYLRKILSLKKMQNCDCGQFPLYICTGKIMSQYSVRSLHVHTLAIYA